MLSADRWHQGECVSVKMNLGLYDLLKSLALKGKCTRAGIKGLRNSEKDFCFYIPVSDTQLERKTSRGGRFWCVGENGHFMEGLLVRQLRALPKACSLVPSGQVCLQDFDGCFLIMSSIQNCCKHGGVSPFLLTGHFLRLSTISPCVKISRAP